MEADESFQAAVEALRDVTFGFFDFQPLTHTVIQPYNDFLNGPIQDIISTPVLYETGVALGLAEFNNVVFMPPFKGPIIFPDTKEEITKLNASKDAALKRVKEAYESIAEVRKQRDRANADLSDKYDTAESRETDAYLRQKDLIQRQYLNAEYELLKVRYAGHRKEDRRLPADCRNDEETYWLDVYADVTLREYEKRDRKNGDEAKILDPNEMEAELSAYINPTLRKFYMDKYTQLSSEISKTFTMVKLFSIPLMVHSAWCWLTLAGEGDHKLSQFGECDIAPKGYFIIDGTSRVFVTQIKLATNEPRCSIVKVDAEKGKVIEHPIMTLKCETRSRKANDLSLVFASPAGKNIIKDVKILFMTLPFMKPNLKTVGKKRVKSDVNVTFNVLWVFRFYVIWKARQGLVPQLERGDSVRMALGEFNRYLMDACHEENVSPGTPTMYYKVVRELVDTIKHMQFSDESPADDEEFIRRLREIYHTEKNKTDVKKKGQQENITVAILKFKAQLDNQFFPQIKCPEYELTLDNDPWKPFLKFTALVQMIVKYVKCFTGAKGVDDRDSFSTIQLATSAIEMGVLIRKALFTVKRKLSDSLGKASGDQFGALFKQNHPSAISDITTHGASFVTEPIRSSFATGNWGLDTKTGGEKRPGVVQILDTKAIMSQYNSIRKTAIPVKRQANVGKPRQVHRTSYGIVDPSNTPDSDQVGLIRSLSVSVMISSDNVAAYDRVMDMISTGIKLGDHVYETFAPDDGVHRYPLYLNNIITGYCDRTFYDRLKEAKRTKKLGWYSEVYMKRETDKWQTTYEVHVKVNAGRAMRPLIVVKNNELPIMNYIMGPKAKYYKSNFLELLNLGCVEYVSASEFESSEVAMTFAKFLRDRNSRRFDYMELDPMMSMSVETATQPFPQHNPNPRAIYYGAMVRQPVSVPFATFAQMQETETKVLHYPHAPLITTDMAKITKTNLQPAGQMVYVAVKSEAGTDEDPTRWRKGFIDNGGLNGTIYTTYEAKSAITIPEATDDPNKYDNGVIRVRYATNNTLDFETMDEKHIFELDDENEKNGDPMEANEEKEYPFPEGFTKTRGATNVFVRPGDTLLRFKSRGEKAEIEKLKITGKRSGFVSHIHTFTSKEGRKIKITTRHPHIPREGDKGANEFAQKGVMGEVIPDDEMPFSIEHGITPDVIFSPTSLPSRMTIGMEYDIFAGAAFAAVDRNRIVKNLIKWSRIQEEPIVNSKNDFWINLSEGLVKPSQHDKFQLVAELRRSIKDEMREAMRRGEEIEFGLGIRTEEDYIESQLSKKIFDMTGEGWQYVDGLEIVDSVAERRFIVPDEDCVSILRTDEKVVLFSQLPIDIQRQWYDRNENTLIPNYMLRVPRDPNDESITDATAFREPDKDKLLKILKSKGFTSHGESKFIDKNGIMTTMTIYSGPLFWMQLSHLADSKYQVRDTGSMSAVSRGAAKGKAVGGAVRSGELSHAAMIAHGASEYLAERFKTAADNYEVLLCTTCGGYCHVKAVTAVPACDRCGSKSLPRATTIPYSGLRVMAMLAAVGAAPSVITRPQTLEEMGHEYEIPEDVETKRTRIVE